MRKVILLITFFSLAACSITGTGMKYENKSPRGISILNIIKEDRVKAYRIAESHCAKYYKVPRVLSSSIQPDDSVIPMTMMVFECLKPSN